MMDLEIKHETDSLTGVVVWAHYRGDKIGYLWLTGEFPHADNVRFVRNIEVVNDYQRRGVATQMWNYAKENGFNPAHDLTKTVDGKAWSAKISEQVC